MIVRPSLHDLMSIVGAFRDLATLLYFSASFSMSLTESVIETIDWNASLHWSPTALTARIISATLVPP